MESPVRDDAGGSGAHAVIDTGPKTAPTPFGQSRAQAFAQQASQQSQDPRAMAQDAGPPHEMAQGAQVQRTGRNASVGAPSRALVFVGVAVVTMVIVIVAGLLILAFSD